MEIVRLHHPYEKEAVSKATPCVLVLGFFDGVHRGHQAVIKTGKDLAKKHGLALAVMTFNQHPAVVFQQSPDQAFQYLSSLRQKEEKMEALGVDVLYEAAFTSAFAAQEPQEFVDLYIAKLQAKIVVAGFDYTYGKGPLADIAHLPDYAKGRFEVVTVAKETDDQEKISSTRIRQLLSDGELEAANRLLGYTYETTGIVVHGEARGRELGFPTANIQIPADRKLPKTGVYANQIKIGDTWYHAMGSIGRNETFGLNRKLTIELNILDFHSEIYGEKVAVRWCHMLREQVAYESAEKLIEQLKKDEQDTREYFEHLEK